MLYLWFLARTPEISDELDAELHAKSLMYLPNYEFTNLLKDDQNPEKCGYSESMQ